MVGRVLNGDRLVRKLSRISTSYQKEVEKALLASAAEMNSYAITKIQRGTSAGRTYRRGGRVHIASAPGAYPNTDYGELVRGMFFGMTGYLTASWGNRAKHAKPLEFGTSRMAARPFIRPTFNALYAKAVKRIGVAVQNAIKASANG